MSKDVKTIRPNSSVQEVAANMNKFNIGSIVVVQDGRPIGMISERDILRKVVEPLTTGSPDRGADHGESAYNNRRKRNHR